MVAADPSRRRRAVALPPAERRAMLADATLPLLIEKGEAVTTGEIAAAAGVAEGTIFRAFASKDELIEAVLDRALDPSRTEQALTALATGEAVDLETMVTRVVQVIQRRVVEVWQLISSVGPRFHSHDRRPSFDSPALTGLLAPYRDQLQVSPSEAARLLRSMIMASTHPLLTDRPMRPRDLAHHFLYGVAAPDSGRGPLKGLKKC